MRWLLNGLLALIGLAALILVGAYLALKRDDVPYDTLAAQYASPASQYVDLPGGVRMHYRDQGQGPVILLIHGFTASLHTWEPWVERLATGDERIGDYRVVSIDLPGHGLTQAPAGYQASIEAFRDVVADFVRARQLERFAIAGSSMGGNVAWEYALAHPEQVQALILVDASGWEDTRPEANRESPAMKALRNPTLGPILIQLDNTRLLREGLRAAFYDPALADDAMVERYTRLARAPGHREIVRQIMVGFGSRNFATAERLAPLRMPVLIMTGDTDRLVPPEHARLFHDAIAGSQLVEFERTGHIPQEERPDESAMAVHEFIYRIQEGSPLAPQ
jgi:pimeloyl-ACP methyl ester carboxylesterase